MGTCFEYEGEQLQAEALGLFVTELDSEIDRLTDKKEREQQADQGT